MPKKLTTEEFIENAKQVHGNRYDYSRAVYRGNKNGVIIICSKHGEFTQTPVTHVVNKSGCPSCGNIKRALTQKDSLEDFIAKANSIHQSKFDYSYANYVNNQTKIIILCPIHGQFKQRPAEHLNGKGCKECGINKRSTEQMYSNEKYKELSKQVHGDKYDYSKVNYAGAFCKVVICCPIHGDFEQLARDHIRGSGCPSCANYGFDKSKPGILYYLKITTDDGKILYKIGITNRTVSERFGLAELSKIEIVKQKLYENGQDAYDLEQKMLKKYKKYKYNGPKVLDSGNTELFTEDVLAMYYAEIN